MKRGRQRKKQQQLALDFKGARGRGGRRAGAGRKKGPRPRVWHRRRPPHVGRHPVHITLRARAGLPSFFHERIRNLVKELLHDQRKAPRRYRHAFHVVHFSIQSDHIHLIVEAVAGEGVEVAPDYDISRALRGGVSGFEIAFALRLNRLLGRKKGKVWAARYHRHDLKTPTETKNALRYVLHNAKKHGGVFYGDGCVDLFSSGVYFDGWADMPEPLFEIRPWPKPIPKTWLLAKGWRRAGPIFTYDRPS